MRPGARTVLTSRVSAPYGADFDGEVPTSPSWAHPTHQTDLDAAGQSTGGVFRCCFPTL